MLRRSRSPEPSWAPRVAAARTRLIDASGDASMGEVVDRVVADLQRAEADLVPRPGAHPNVPRWHRDRHLPHCRGIWLDRGEIDKLASTPEAPPPPRPVASEHEFNKPKKKKKSKKKTLADRLGDVLEEVLDL